MNQSKDRSEIISNFVAPKRAPRVFREKMTKVIQRLDPKVINQIAAGEVIQRPSNALKELIENALDAGGTNIRITAHHGGLKQLLIQDNGSGISFEDLPLVCERFATSKLKELKDLESIQSFGFRGEALASISHVAHVTITTKTAASSCAYKAHYRDGKLAPFPSTKSVSSEPIPCAGTVGTQILVEDLFYNLKTRKQALKSASEEYKLIVDVVAKYAIHHPGVGFVCKKYRDTASDVLISNRASKLDAIRIIYSKKTSRELLEFDCSDQSYRDKSQQSLETDIQFNCTGYVSNANFSVKKSRFIIFINNRLVQCSVIKRAIENLYTLYLPKSSHPFVYLALTIPGKNIDVNVHPTKQEVHFLYSDEIVEALVWAIETLLKGANNSRTFYAQTLLTSSDVVLPAEPAESTNKRKKTTSYTPHKAVRTDPTSRKMDRYVSTSQGTAIASQGPETEPEENVETFASIQSIKNRIRDQKDVVLIKILKNHTFVGAVDHEFSLIQYNTKLYMISHVYFIREYLYQQIIRQFAKFSTITLSTPLSVHELVIVALDSPTSTWTEEDGSKEAIAQEVVTHLEEKAPMLADYFGLSLNSQNCLVKIPQIGPIVPSMARLPEFLLDLNSGVDWETEENCFHTLAIAIARWYSYMDGSSNVNETDHTRNWVLEHEFSPEWKRSSTFVPSRALRAQQRVWEVACVENLYKIFERC